MDVRDEGHLMDIDIPQSSHLPKISKCRQRQVFQWTHVERHLLLGVIRSSKDERPALAAELQEHQ